MKFYARRTVASLLGIEDRQVAQVADEAETTVMRAVVGPTARLYSLQNVFDMAAYLRKKKRPNKLPMRVVTTNIPRGGTGKTLVATNLAVSFALNGIRTMLIDVDYQASATLLMGYNPDVDSKIAASRDRPAEKVVDYHLGDLIGLTGAKVMPFEEVVKHPFGINGPSLIPGDVSLTRLDYQLTADRMHNIKSDLTFANWLAKCPEMQEYEAVIFDSGPGFNRIISASLAASNMVVAPVGLERVSDKGLRILSDEIEKLREDFGLKTEMRIIANTMVPTQRVLNEIKHISSIYPSMVLPRSIRRSEDVPKSYSGHGPDADLLPYMLEYPSTEVTDSLKEISSLIFNELWTGDLHG